MSDIDYDQQIAENIEKSLGEIAHPSQPKGSNMYGSTKIFPDYTATKDQYYFQLVHGIAHESSVSFVVTLQAIRAPPTFQAWRSARMANDWHPAARMERSGFGRLAIQKNNNRSVKSSTAPAFVGGIGVFSPPHSA